MIEYKERHFCQKNLEDKIALMTPQKFFQVNKLWINNTKTHIELKIYIPPFYNQRVEKQIVIPFKTEGSH